jgi:hypothetical protein
MKMIRDYYGRSVRLADERVLQVPTRVRLSRSDDAVQLFYEFYAQTLVAGNGSMSW